MRWHEVSLVARKELRETLRDRRTLAVMVLFPLVVYPLISLVTAQVLAARVAREDAHVARIALGGPPALLAELRRRLSGPGLALRPPATAADLTGNRVDAVVEIERAAGDKPPTARILYDETREDSTAARDRVAEALGAAAGARCPPAFTIVSHGVAPRARVSGYLLSKVIPLVVVVMVMLGAFHPAIDITAGERERGTLETTLSAPIDRTSLMAGKVLAVATLAALTGFMNLASMSLTVLEGARLVAPGGDLSIPWLRTAAAFAVVPPTAFLFASVMVAIGALARSYKEAQTLLTPVYVLCMAPSLTAALGDFRLEGVTAWIPGVSVTLLARDLMLGRAPLLQALAVLASTIGYGLAALALAARLYDSERLFFSDEASLGLGVWLRHLVRRGGRERGGPAVAENASYRPTAGHALLLYAIACVLLFFVFAPLEVWRFGPGLAIAEWVGLGGLTWIYARGQEQSLSTVLRLRRPSATAMAAALLIGASAWLWVGLLADWILPAPKELVESLRRMIAPPNGDRGLAATLFLMALTPALCEEALFRGPILRGLRTRFPAVGAALLTGLLFGIFHLDAWRLLPTALLGAVLSGIALRADSIVPAMLAHFTNNACLIFLARTQATDPAELPRTTKLGLFAAAGLVSAGGVWLLTRAKTRAQEMRRVM